MPALTMSVGFTVSMFMCGDLLRDGGDAGACERGERLRIDLDRLGLGGLRQHLAAADRVAGFVGDKLGRSGDDLAQGVDGIDERGVLRRRLFGRLLSLLAERLDDLL